MSKTRVCVGGPLDGQIYTILYGDHFQIRARPPIDFSDGSKPCTATADVIVYERQVLEAGGEEGPTVWAPAGQSGRDTLAMLLRGYRTHTSKECAELEAPLRAAVNRGMTPDEITQQLMRWDEQVRRWYEQDRQSQTLPRHSK